VSGGPPEAQREAEDGGTPSVTQPPGALSPLAVSAPLAVPTAGASGPSAGAPGALARVRDVATQLVPQLQFQVMRLGVAGQAGLAALSAAAAVAIAALIPAHHAVQSVNAELLQAQRAPSGRSIEQAVPRLMASLPTRAQMPAVLGQVYAEAAAAGVPLASGRYTFTPAKSGVVARYSLEFPVKGAPYPQIRTFIDRTLTVVPAASLDKLQVERKAIGEQAVNADIGFVVFVRNEDGS
jgi:hypothetical protein